MTWRYPAGSLDALIAGDAVSEPTRAALGSRGVVANEPSFFDAAHFALLIAVVARLAPWSGLAPVIATAIDARLAAGKGNGWRFAELPEDGTAYRDLLGLIDAAGFLALGAVAQDDLLHDIQARPDTARLVGELLAEVTEFAFAQPAALAAIGYSGLADAPGWTEIGLDDRELREAVEHG